MPAVFPYHKRPNYPLCHVSLHLSPVASGDFFLKEIQDFLFQSYLSIYILYVFPHLYHSTWVYITLQISNFQRSYVTVTTVCFTNLFGVMERTHCHYIRVFLYRNKARSMK